MTPTEEMLHLLKENNTLLRFIANHYDQNDQAQTPPSPGSQPPPPTPHLASSPLPLTTTLESAISRTIQILGYISTHERWLIRSILGAHNAQVSNVITHMRLHRLTHPTLTNKSGTPLDIWARREEDVYKYPPVPETRAYRPYFSSWLKYYLHPIAHLIPHSADPLYYQEYLHRISRASPPDNLSERLEDLLPQLG